jgi:hypothetical protein
VPSLPELINLLCLCHCLVLAVLLLLLLHACACAWQPGSSKIDQALSLRFRRSRLGSSDSPFPTCHASSQEGLQLLGRGVGG